MSGISRITEERQRQIEKFGFTTQHDYQHQDGELAEAACYFASPIYTISANKNFEAAPLIINPTFFYPESWDERFATRGNHTRIQNLSIAGALIAAEIDRLEDMSCHASAPIENNEGA